MGKSRNFIFIEKAEYFMFYILTLKFETVSELAKNEDQLDDTQTTICYKI